MQLTQQRVLLIDDDASYVRAMKRTLASGGYAVQTAGSAEEGSRMIGIQRLHAILLDLDLPGLSGLVLLREMLRQHIVTPVIVISGSDKIDDVIQALRLNAADYLRKPFGPEELFSALDRIETPTPKAKAPPSNPTNPTRPSRPANPRPPTNRGAATPPVAATATEPPHIRARPNAARVSSTIAETNARLCRQLAAGEIGIPVLDPRVRRLQRLVTAPHSSVNDVLTAIGNDPGLTASVLREANSALFGTGRAVSNLQEACVRLGNATVSACILEELARATFRCKKPEYRDLMGRMKHNAGVTARISAQLAQHTRLSDADLYIAGLLHNVGELMLIQHLASTDGPTLTLHEISSLNDEHHESFGSAVAASWKFSDPLRRLMSRHHTEPTGAYGDYARFRDVVLAAWNLACDHGYAVFGRQRETSADPHLHRLGIEPVDVRAAVAAARRPGPHRR